MTFLKRPSSTGKGREKGTFATSPAEVDAILHEVWDPITAGNHSNIYAATEAFFKKQSQRIVHGSPYNIQPLKVEDFKRVCQNGKKSAAGLDGWTASDLSLLPDYGYELLVRLLNTIEEGAEWPEHMLETRAVFLAKDPDDVSNPLPYRILKITSGIYRKWATTRLQDLTEWIDTWDHPALNAGVPGKGAQDAWMRTALNLEHNKLQAKQTAGGSIDVFKCFDQVNRPLIAELALEAGMPPRILHAYFRYIDNLQVRYQVGHTIGINHYERCSIPQGCPFSMAMIALVTRVWISYMEEIHVEPRCLADDLLFMASGSGHCARCIRAMQASREFFEDLGAKVATNKCFVFAIALATRKFLQHYVWDDKGLKLPVLSNFRDLGAHLNLTGSSNGSTLTARLLRAIGMAKRLCWLPVNRSTREKNVRCNIIPAALYGA